MKKILLLIISLFCLNCSSTFAIDEVIIVPTFSSKEQAQNRVWVGTFQLVWNDFMNEIVKKPIKFVDKNTKVVKQLNKQEFTADMLSEKDYYKKYGETSLALKQEIETAIMEKFGERSEILDKIDWTSNNRAYVVYAMLKKDFSFLKRFNQLAISDFGPYESKYFGINETSKAQLYSNVRVLFYDSPANYAVVLNTQSNDEVYLYRTNDNQSFDKLYKKMKKQAKRYKGNQNFVEGDKLKVPYLTFKKVLNYDFLCNRLIKNTNNLYLAKALQSVDFDLNEAGVKLKSEAALDVQFMSFMPRPVTEGRNFYFDNTFVIFLKEKNKEMPYFAARINDIILFNK